MLKLITHNFSIKLGCFLLSLLLWVYVSAGQSTVGKFPSSLKIKAINNPAGLVAVYDQKTVNIKVMAEPSVWKKLSADSFSAYIDLTGASAGTIEFPVNVVSSVPGVQIVERDPQKVLVTLEPIVTKEISINKRVEGSAAEGMTTGVIELLPEKVSVSGAKSMVENLIEAMAVINLNGEAESFRKKVSVAAYDDDGEVLSGIEFKPSEIEARVPIVKASNNKTVGIKVKTSGSPKTGYYIGSIVVSPSVVDITGPRTIISEINYVETELIDVTNIDDTLEKDIDLKLTDGLSLQQGAPEKVRVRINLSKSDTSKEITAAISYRNLESGMKVSNLVPNQVRVVCTGPSEQVSALSSSDVVLNLDLRGKTVGTHLLELTGGDFSAPPSVTVATILPSSVTVTIEAK